MKRRFTMLEPDRPEPAQAAENRPAGTAVRGGGYHLDEARREERVGKHERALAAYTRCLKEDRGCVAAWVGQVRMLVHLREHDEGVLWAEKALELMKNNGDLL
ncbi:MAG: hypothetical protein ACT4PL_04870, partial [Phycisphaerales bacterium]